MIRLVFAILGVWLSTTELLWAACEPVAGDIVSIQTLGKDGLVRLADGREVKLAGLLLPGADGSRGKGVAALTERSRAALAAWVKGRRAHLFYGATRQDRYGRILAHLVVLPVSAPGPVSGAGDGIPAEIFTATAQDGLPGEVDGAFWLQGALLREGWARVYSRPDDRLCVGVMLALEKAAREAVRGLWAAAAYRVHASSNLAALLALKGSFQLVEGSLLAVAERRGTVFLNFGPDWRHDFTVTAKKATVRSLVRSFSDEAGPLDVLRGRRVRVRGWIDEYNGPEITLTHPEQIEVFDAAENKTKTVR